MAGGLVDLYGGTPATTKSSSSGPVDLYAQPASAKSSVHGGLLGPLENAAHWLGSKAELAGHDVAAMPGGVAKLGVDLYKSLTDPYNWTHGGHNASQAEQAQHAPFLSDVAAMGTGAVQSVEHPGRDPFQTLLTVLPAAAAAGRVAEASALAARVARGDMTLKDAATILRRPHVAATRTLRMGEKDVNLLPSRNASVRAIQKGYDKVVQRAINKDQSGAGAGRVTGRIAAHGIHRFRGALAEEERAAQKLSAVPADLLDRSAARLRFGKLPRTARENQAALELTSTQTMPGEAAAYHEAQAAAGVNPELNRAVAKVYRGVEKRNLVHLNESAAPGEQVHINPAEKQLAAVDQRLLGAANKGDQILVEHNQLTPQAAQLRINKPGRVRAGATYEKPTPGKLGVESPALKAARDQRNALAKQYEAALQKDEKWLAETQSRNLGQLSPTDAQARLAELDKQYQALVDKTIPRVSPYTRLEQLRRNTIKGRTGRNLGNVKAEEQQLADAAIRKAVADHPNDPAAQAVGKILQERDQLRAALQSHAESPLLGTEPQALPSAPASGHASVPMPSNPVRDEIVTTGHRLAAAQRRVDQLEAAAAGRIKPTGIVGGESARPGRNFTSYKTSEPAPPQTPVARTGSVNTGAPKPPITKAEMTGEGIRQGMIPKDITGMAARHYRQLIRFVNTARQRDSIWQTGSDISKGTGHEVLLAKPEGETLGEITALAKQLTGQEKATFDTAHELTAQEEAAATSAGIKAAVNERIAGWLDRSHETTNMAGVEAPKGYRWVDKRLLNDLQEQIAPKSSGGAKVGRGFDNVNSAVTSATVYFKVGHTGTRALTNAATNLMQGSLHPLELARTWKLMRDAKASMSPAEYEQFQARLLGAGGQMGYAALPMGGTEGMLGHVVSGAARKGAMFWARRFDAPFRLNSLVYEMRKAGYATPQALDRALAGIETGGRGLPAHEWAKVSAAFRRADREAISYDRLNSFERRFLSRAIWFYPWVKGSTMFTLRSMVEHPYKMGALGAAGVMGRKQQLAELGPVPSYEQGLFQVGSSKGRGPLVTDFSTFSPFATAGQLADMPEVPGALSSQFNPALSAIGSLAYGLNPYGAPSKSPLKDAFIGAVSPTPEYQLIEAALAGGQDQSQRMFAKTPWAELERYLGGPATPRRVNLAALAKAAAREQSGQR